DRNVLFFQKVAHEVERGAPYSDCHRGDDWAGGVEGRHHVFEAALAADFGAAEYRVEWDSAVVEDYCGGVGGADAELVFDPDHRHARSVVLDDERLDTGAS